LRNTDKTYLKLQNQTGLFKIYTVFFKYQTFGQIEELVLLV